MEDEILLIQNMLAGDKRAARKFIVLVRPIAQSVLRSHAYGDAHLLDDLIQGLFTHLWERDQWVVRQWSREVPLSAYVRRVAKNFAIDQLRKQQRRQQHEVPVLHDGGSNDELVPRAAADWLDTSPGPAATYFLKVRRERVDAFLKALPAGEREVLLLMTQGLTGDEAAKHLQIRADAYRARLSRALKRALDHPPEVLAILRDLLDEWPPETIYEGTL